MSLPGKEKIIEVQPEKVPQVDPQREIYVDPISPLPERDPAPEPVEPEKVPA